MNAQLVKIRLRLPFAAVHVNSGEVIIDLHADQLADALGNLSDLSGPHGKTADQLADLVILSSISDRRIEACAHLLRSSIDETDGAEWEPAAVEAITRAAESVCHVAGMNPGLHEAAVHRMRRASGLALGRSSIQDPADSDLDSILYDVGGDTGNEFQRRLIRYGIEWARDHFAPSESASREQCDRIAQMLADNPLNRMCDADSDPSPDVVTVPREEWDGKCAELASAIRMLWMVEDRFSSASYSEHRQIQGEVERWLEAHDPEQIHFAILRTSGEAAQRWEG